MKPTKIILVLLVAAGTMISAASFAGTKPGLIKCVNVSFERAMHIPGLPVAMRDQLNPGFLNNNQLVYTVSVRLGDTVYRVTGTYYQWVAFFNPLWVNGQDKKSPGLSQPRLLL